MLNPFEEKLKKRLENYEENPAPDAWDGIDKRVHTSEPGGLDAANLLTELGLLIFLGFIILNGPLTNEQNDLAGNPITVYDTERQTPLLNSVNEGQAKPFSVHDSSQRHGGEIKLVSAAQKDFKQSGKSSSKINGNTDPFLSTNSTNVSLKNANDIVVPANKEHFNLQNTGAQNTLGFTRNSIFNFEIPSLDQLAQPSAPPLILVQEDEGGSGEVLSDQTEILSDTGNTTTKPSVELDSVKGLLPHDTLSDLKRHQKKIKRSILSNGLWYGQTTPLLTYQRLESNREDDHYVNDLNSLPVFSPKRLGFRIEAGREWAIHPKLRISLGIVYLQRRQRIEYSTRSVERMEVMQSSPGSVIMTPVFQDEKRILDFKSKSIGLSSQLTYLVMGAGPLKSYGGVGLDYQVALSPVTYKDEFSESARNLNLTFFYRVTYQLSGQMMIYAQPSYSYAVGSRDSFSTSLYSAPHTVGMGVGLLFSSH